MLHNTIMTNMFFFFAQRRLGTGPRRTVTQEPLCTELRANGQRGNEFVAISDRPEGPMVANHRTGRDFGRRPQDPLRIPGT